MIKVLFGICCTGLALCLITSFVNPGMMVENDPPQVEIVEPTQNDRFSWNSIIRYNIRIKDKEDGESEYDEINAKEVLLEACYLPDDASAKTFVAKKKTEKENKGLTLIRTSDCFNCHSSKGKLIGPSFEMIAEKYKITDSSIKRLTNNVINGSSGIWSPAAMPAHKAMKENDVKEMVRWILQNGTRSNIAYYPGIEGGFKTQNKPVKQPVWKVLVLTASYTDHGDKETRKNTKYGQHSISLKAVD